jgi:hypothetical protein
MLPPPPLLAVLLLVVVLPPVVLPVVALLLVAPPLPVAVPAAELASESHPANQGIDASVPIHSAWSHRMLHLQPRLSMVSRPIGSLTLAPAGRSIRG